MKNNFFKIFCVLIITALMSFNTNPKFQILKIGKKASLTNHKMKAVSESNSSKAVLIMNQNLV